MSAKLPRPYKPRPIQHRNRVKIGYWYDPVVLERLRSMAGYQGLTQEALITTLINREYERLRKRTDYEGIIFPTQADIERQREPG